jgi:hypothetical protein
MNEPTMNRYIKETGLTITLLTCVPQTKPEKWYPAYGVCGLDSEGRVLFHPELCGLEDRALKAAGSLYLAKLADDDDKSSLCPLVRIEWAKEKLPEQERELGMLEERIRHLAASGSGETKVLLTLEAVAIQSTNECHRAFENTTLAETIAMALSLPRGQGIINELAHEGPYLRGVFDQTEPQTRTDAGFTCPYCKSPVLHYHYPQIGLNLYICREIGYFMGSTSYKIRRKFWRGLVAKTAKTWTQIEAERKGGLHGGQN